MPVYEYRCAKCGEEFEQFVRSITQQTAPTCPKCGASDVRKAISLVGTRGNSGSGRSVDASCAPTGT
jgi:putative FmdB family regulatory protein